MTLISYLLSSLDTGDPLITFDTTTVTSTGGLSALGPTLTTGDPTNFTQTLPVTGGQFTLTVTPTWWTEDEIELTPHHLEHLFQGPAAPVPEPSTLLLLCVAIGVVVFLLLWRRMP